jgi:hypothetical protein
LSIAELVHPPYHEDDEPAAGLMTLVEAIERESSAAAALRSADPSSDRSVRPNTPLLPRGAPSAARESRRGAHVKGRPEMQQTARDGAAHWAACAQRVRTAWTERAARRPEFRARFAAQADAAHGRVKCKLECLLRFLQMAADDGIVSPGPFGHGGFFGWCRFTVTPARAPDFRRGLEGLFPARFREDTLKETFRRAGLIPERWQWEQAWRGGVAFEARPPRD